MNSQPPLPDNETARLDALGRYQILDTPPEKVFDDFTFLAAQICHTPVAIISFIDGNRQWFKSKLGLTVTETCRDVAFCCYTILQQELLVVRNALVDTRFATNPLVTSDPNIRFYAGAPIVTPDGFAIGTLCVIDTVPRELSLEQGEALRVLSRQVLAQLELRLNVINLSRSISQREQVAEQLRRRHYIEGFYHRGLDKARSGDYFGAIEDFNQFLQLNPNGIKAYYNRGLVRCLLLEHKGALADFDQFLKFNPNDVEALRNRGLVRAELGDYLGAIADYNQAMHNNPNYTIADDNLGLTHPELGEHQEHQEVILTTESLHLNPGDAKADISQGNTSSELEDPWRATKGYSEFLHLHPNGKISIEKKSKK